MKAIAEIQILPVNADNGDDVLVQVEVERARDILVASGLEVAVHAQSTDIEGELEDVFDTLKQLHVYLDHCNVLRLSTVVRLESEQEHGGSAARSRWSYEERNLARRPVGPSASERARAEDACVEGSDSFVTVWQIASPTN